MATTAQHGDADRLRALLDALLATRSGAAAARFDAELGTALAEGEVTREAAERLKAWHDAALREVEAHVRATVPGALGALAVAHADAEDRADALERSLERPLERPLEKTSDEPALRHGRQHPPPTARNRHDTPGHASSPLPPVSSTLGPRPPRQMLADLVRTSTPTYRDRQDPFATPAPSDPPPAEKPAEVS